MLSKREVTNLSRIVSKQLVTTYDFFKHTVFFFFCNFSQPSLDVFTTHYDQVPVPCEASATYSNTAIKFHIWMSADTIILQIGVICQFTNQCESGYLL